jgi:hypothetical protein
MKLNRGRGMAYIPHGIRVPTHDADLCWDGAGGVEGNGRRRGRENEGRRRKEHMRKKGSEAYV